MSLATRLCYHTLVDKIFGSRVRTEVLVALALIGPSYVYQLARVLGYKPTEVRRAVGSLEFSDLVRTRRFGTVRMVELNRRLPEFKALLTFLLLLGERPNYARKWKIARRRPRAIGKAL